MKVSKFYDEEYTSAAFYASFRACASYIDGLKNGARKVIHVIDRNNIVSDIKNSSLAAKVVESQAYLHGQVSLEGTIVTLAQDFSGTNNFNLLKPEGNFGNRFIHEASASRYVFTRKSEWFDKFLNKDDYPVLVSQSFEGEPIEPRFYVPTLPLILLNGSEGVGNGFAQKILPRGIGDVKSAIKAILSGKKADRILPWIRGFEGNILFMEGNKVEIQGLVEIRNSNTVHVKEIPYQYDLDSYLKVLNTLMDKKIIKNYTDKSDNGKFLFIIDVAREFTKRSLYEILDDLKLIKRVTENFTCIDEENRIVEFENEIDLLDAYVKIRLDYYQRRKDHLLENLGENKIFLDNQIKFIENILSGKLAINGKRRQEIESRMEAIKLDKMEGSYDYLLRMPIWSLTEEKIVELKNRHSVVLKEIVVLKAKTLETMWKEDLDI